MRLHEKAVKGVFWSGIQNCGSSVVAALVLFVVTCYVPKEDFGLVGIALAFILFMELVLKQGFAQALVQRAKLDPEHLDTAFWTGIGLAVVISAGCVFSAEWVAAVYNEPDLTPVLRWLSVCLLTGSLGYTQEAILRRRLAFKILAIRQLLAVLGGGVVGIGMAILGYGIWSLVGQLVTTGVIGAAVLWLACNWRPGLKFSGRHLRELWSFSVFVMGVNVLVFVTRRSDMLLIGYFLGIGPAGIYFVAFRLLSAVTQAFTQTIAAVALPTFSRIQHDAQQMRHAFGTATQITALISFPVFVGLATLAPELVSVLFGEDWTGCVPVVRLLAMSGCVQALFHFTGPVILAKGKASMRFWLALLNASVQVVAVLIAVHWGIVAVALAGLVRISLMYPVFMLMVRRLITVDLKASLYRSLMPTVATVLMSTAVFALNRLLVGFLPPAASLGVCIAVGVLVYSSLIFAFARPLADQTLSLLRLAVLPSSPDDSTQEFPESSDRATTEDH